MRAHAMNLWRVPSATRRCADSVPIRSVIVRKDFLHHDLAARLHGHPNQNKD
ncbi:MAG: hypothetical protein ACI9DC_000183 [Gammaproteobacteria bacterium]|jgi:hypothetical protein